MEKEKSTSVVGSKKELVLKEFQHDLKMRDDLLNCHHRISYRISDIFNNYLQIASELIEIQDGNLLSITEYTSILDYAADQFELSSTTTSNIINIYKRFTDENGRIKTEYKNYQFSKLVEMISLPEEQLQLIEPNMTVKEIRLVKKAANLEDLIPDMISNDSLYGLYLKTIKEYDWFKDVEHPEQLSIESKVTDSDGNYRLFTTTILLKSKQPKYVYKMELSLKKDSINLNHSWHYDDITSLDHLNRILDGIHASMLDTLNSKSSIQKEDDKSTQDITLNDPTIYNFSLSYDLPVFSHLLENYLGKLYKLKQGDMILFYDHQVIKKNDPYVFKVVRNNDSDINIYDHNDKLIFSSLDIVPLIQKAFKPYQYTDGSIITGQMSIDDLQEETSEV